MVAPCQACLPSVDNASGGGCCNYCVNIFLLDHKEYMYKKTDYLANGVNFLKQQYLPSAKIRLGKLMFYATDICNSRCKHCLIWAKRPVVHMPMSKILEVMGSSCITSRTNIGLEGGEFLLHPEAENILDWFSRNHRNYDLLSNCLQPDRLIALAGKYKPRRLFVSLDGTEETYLYMRGKDGYKHVLEVIKSLGQVLPVSVMFTLSPYNGFEDMFHVAEVCKKYNIDLRIGIYNNIAFFDTVDDAHSNEVSSLMSKLPIKVSAFSKTAAGSMRIAAAAGAGSSLK